MNTILEQSEQKQTENQTLRDEVSALRTQLEEVEAKHTEALEGLQAKHTHKGG
eukprot:m.16705 g.16705  ORF g.16705 m.16705 type:complete len:53 (-) comp10671_c0_seq1:107-265(-)